MTTAVLERTGSPASPYAMPAPIPYGRLVAVEWRKTLGSRAARWVLVAVGLITAGILAIPLSFPSDIDQNLADYVYFAGTGLSILLPVVLILSLTSEWSQRTALATFTQEPRRIRVLSAKLSVGGLLTLACTVVAGALASVALVLSSLIGRDVAWSIAWQDVVALVAFSLLNVAMGMAFAALLQNTAAAIVTFYLIGVVWGFLGAFESIKKFAEWLDPNRALEHIQSGDWGGRWPEIATAFAVWIVLPLIAGAARTLRRDVS